MLNSDVWYYYELSQIVYLNRTLVKQIYLARRLDYFFMYVTETQAYQQKTEKFFVSEEKKFGRIDSWCLSQTPMHTQKLTALE